MERFVYERQRLAEGDMKPRVMLVSIVPPRNDCGVRIVMYRHLVERNPFELYVASNADFDQGLLIHTQLRLPYPIYRLRKSRFGPGPASWITDYENLIWPLKSNRALEEAMQEFQPQVILTLAETGLCHIARKTAERHKLPLAGLFLDWFPMMKGHYGHKWTQGVLSRRYRELYAACDLGFCTSEGMQEVLGPHPNSHVIYPMPGRHRVPDKVSPPSNGKFRLVYVGCVEHFYGRMLCSLIEQTDLDPDIELVVGGPNADWPIDILARSRAKGNYLGFRSPQETADLLATADALLVVMSFEKEFELFMRTSFPTKFLDYVSFRKPVILWGPEYCTPMRVVRRSGGAMPINTHSPQAVIEAVRTLAADCSLRERLVKEAEHLHQGLFNPDRLQEIFVRELHSLVNV